MILISPLTSPPFIRKVCCHALFGFAQDYHKPTDDPGTLNYEVGTDHQVYRVMMDLVGTWALIVKVEREIAFGA